MDPASVMRAVAATRAAGTARIRATEHSDSPLGEQFGLDLTGLADLVGGRARLEGPGIVIVRDADTHYGHPEGRGRWVRRRKRPSDLLESPLWFLDGRIDWSTSAGRLQARAPSVRAGWLQRVLAGPAGDAAAVDVEFETDEAGRIVLASFRGRPHERPPNWERMSEDERESFTHAFGAFGRARWRTTRLSDFGVNTEIALPPEGLIHAVLNRLSRDSSASSPHI